MVLTRNKNDASQFAKKLNTAANRDIAASYTGDTKNSNLILQKFEKGNLIYIVCVYIYILNGIFKEKFIFWLYVVNFWKDMIEKR